MRNFKTVAFTVLKLCFASKSVTNGRTDGRTDGQTNPEAICPSNFFEMATLHMEMLSFNHYPIVNLS